MPRKPIDYSKSLVYRIAYKDITYYIGSTTNFKNRKTQHKSNCKNVKSEDYNKALYIFIRENGGWSDDWVMVLVQYYPNCKTSIELLKYEREHYDIYKPELNVYKPYLYEGEREDNIKEYRKDNAEYFKKYYIENTDKMNEYTKQYQIDNADKIKEYTKQYQIDNADKIKEYNKEYRKENSDKLKEKSKQYRADNDEKLNGKHNCKCGSIYSNQNELRHMKTKKHINYLNNISTNSING
jgi:hypothetical protein